MSNGCSTISGGVDVVIGGDCGEGWDCWNKMIGPTVLCNIVAILRVLWSGRTVESHGPVT